MLVLVKGCWYLYLQLMRLIFMCWVSCTSVTFGGLVTDVKLLNSLSAHPAGMVAIQFLSKYIFTGINKRCVKENGLLRNLTHVVWCGCSSTTELNRFLNSMSIWEWQQFPDQKSPLASSQDSFFGLISNLIVPKSFL